MISARTPGGTPNRCPVCDAAIWVEPSEPPGDSPCPNCGTLPWFTKKPDGLWFWDDETAAPIRKKVMEFLCDELGVNKEAVEIDADIHNLGTDSLDMVELVMELEEEFGITIPNEEAEKIKTIRDLVDCLLWRMHH